MPIITLTSDFGTLDGYVGAMKGVILGMAPTAVVTDIAHDIPAQDVEAGAWCVGLCWAYFPVGTIHIAVVDPGVGTDRAGLLACVDGQYLIGPDNGVFTQPLSQAKTVEVRKLRDSIHRSTVPSTTFHGRDIFAYAAGLLAAGEADWRALSEPVDAYTLLAQPGPAYDETEVRGRVLHVDRYGNLITNIVADRLPPDAQWMVRVGGATVSAPDLSRTYGDVGEGSPVVLIGSTGRVEIAVHAGSASRVFSVDRGAEIVMKKLV